MDKEKELQIPQYLPNKYYRECADEDGCMTKYRVVTDRDSYREGYNTAKAHYEAEIREIIDWIDVFLQPRYLPLSKHMEFKSVLEETWRKFKSHYIEGEK